MQSFLREHKAPEKKIPIVKVISLPQKRRIKNDKKRYSP